MRIEHCIESRQLARMYKNESFRGEICRPRVCVEERRHSLYEYLVLYTVRVIYLEKMILILFLLY